VVRVTAVRCGSRRADRVLVEAVVVRGRRLADAQAGEQRMGERGTSVRRLDDPGDVATEGARIVVLVEDDLEQLRLLQRGEPAGVDAAEGRLNLGDGGEARQEPAPRGQAGTHAHPGAEEERELAACG